MKQGPWAQTEKQEAPPERQETLLHCEGARALKQCAQGGGGVSILGDAQEQSEHGPGQPGQGGPAWAGGLGQVTSGGPVQPQRFCDSNVAERYKVSANA